jgi:hypothetical protein
MKRPIAVVYVVGLFLLGIVIGALGMHVFDAHYQRPPWQAPWHGPGRGPMADEPGPGRIPGGPGFEGRLGWFAEQLELTAEQERQVRDVLADSHHEAEQLHQEMFPRVRALMEQTRERISALLSDEQRDRFETIVAGHRGYFERMFLHGPGGPHPLRGKRPQSSE